MENCLFCKIIRGEIPSTKVYEDENTYAFRDINPQAPTHVLIVPKKHMANVMECDNETMGHILDAAKAIAKAEGVTESGFRLVTNCGTGAGQTVFHLHFHLLGGKQLSDHMD